MYHFTQVIPAGKPFQWSLNSSKGGPASVTGPPRLRAGRIAGRPTGAVVDQRRILRGRTNGGPLPRTRHLQSGGPRHHVLGWQWCRPSSSGCPLGPSRFGKNRGGLPPDSTVTSSCQYCKHKIAHSSAFTSFLFGRDRIMLELNDSTASESAVA